MDLSSANLNPLKEFISLNKFQNFITEPTRVRTRFLKSSNDESSSSTLIDVIIHNKDLIKKTKVVSCPYSDHKFVLASINVDKHKPEPEIIWSRNLSENNIKLIEDELIKQDYSKIDKLYSSNEKWEYLKKLIITALDKIAPLKKITIKQQNKFPWFDLELYRSKKARDISYSKAIKSRLANDWDTYRDARNNFHKLNRSKLLSFFEKKGTKDFKNSKKFWDFYKTSVKIRSDRAHSDSPT
jgi:hypothetical protein